MQPIIPNRPTRSRPYAWGSITVSPDPPRVGAVGRIEFPLANHDVDEVLVERIDTQVALFGIGVEWEQLPSIGPFRLPPDPDHVERASVEWTPKVGGHRCVRSTISVAGVAEPLRIGRNLHVIEAQAADDFWRVPFRLGNPERAAAPIVLRFGGNEAAALDVAVRVGERVVPLDRPLVLRSHEVLQAELLLFARTEDALRHVRTVEAYIGDRLLDGIQVTVYRPAQAREHALTYAPGRVPAAELASRAHAYASLV
jgi:hypothetical protein